MIQVQSQSDLQPGYRQIPEPVGNVRVPIEEVDLVIVPGIGFDTRGGRLGYGAGCYDRLLKSCSPRPYLLGFAYDFQVIDGLPMQRHDVPMNALATEQKLWEFTTRAL